MTKQMNNDNERKEQLFNAYYAYVGEHHVKNVIEELNKDRDKIAEMEDSERLTKWFNSFLYEQKKREHRLKRSNIIQKIAKRVAIILAVVITSTFVVTVSVEAYRERFFSLFTDDRKKYTNIIFEENVTKQNQLIPENWKEYYPTYVPDGFILTGIESNLSMHKMEFENLHGEKISFTQLGLSSTLHADTENGGSKDIVINGFNGILIEKNNIYTIFWHTHEAAFSLESNLSIEELTKIANSVKK